MKDMTTKRTVKELIAEARTKIDDLPAADMARALEASDVLLVDLREPAERAEHGAIPGALAAPRGMLEFYADAGTPYHKKEFEPKWLDAAIERAADRAVEAPIRG